MTTHIEVPISPSTYSLTLSLSLNSNVREDKGTGVMMMPDCLPRENYLFIHLFIYSFISINDKILCQIYCTTQETVCGLVRTNTNTNDMMNRRMNILV